MYKLLGITRSCARRIMCQRITWGIARAGRIKIRFPWGNFAADPGNPQTDQLRLRPQILVEEVEGCAARPVLALASS